MARPTKLTPEVQEQITRLIRVGNTVEVSAEAAGIARNTFNHWMQRGTEEGVKNKPHRDFREAVERARAEAEANLVARIAKAAQNGSWSAAGWLLERRAPERWGKASDRISHEKEKDAQGNADDDPILRARDDLAARRRTRAA